MTTTFIQNQFHSSPLDQFEVRDLLSLDLQILSDLHLSVTNIGLYLSFAAFVVFALGLLSSNYNRLVPNNWSIAQETIYDTVYSIVVNQINARNGQIYFPFIFVLFIFILINNLIGMVNRCLCTYINKHMLTVLITGSMIRLYSLKTSISSTHYNLKGNNFYLNPYYITGFVDAEGCFTTSIYKDDRMQTKWQVKPIFQIALHNKDTKILEAIQRTWGVGKIYKHGKDSSMYRVSSLKDLKVIINHFDKYPLITKKLGDYILFKQSVEMIASKQHLTWEGLLKLVSIKATLNTGLSEKFKETFPNVIPVLKPDFIPTEIKDIYWLIGFIEGEGCFMVVIQESKNNKVTHNVSLRFNITQHSKDSELLKSLITYLDCGRCISARNEITFIVSTFSDIYHKIIPLLEKYTLIGNKKEDYLDFCKVANLILSKDHLTKEGLEKINLIKSNMNRNRTNEP